MEFSKKLQELRKQKELTQEELAEILYVSRTAVSKWESGRGFPSIESLKAISRFFSISVDELLSSEEIFDIAQRDQKQKETLLRDMIFGLLDCATVLLLFFPFFGLPLDNYVKTVSLLNLSGAQTYVTASYFAYISVSALFGVITLALQNCQINAWVKTKTAVSLIISTLGVCMFILSKQPYPSVFVFLFLIIKAILLIKRR